MGTVVRAAATKRWRAVPLIAAAAVLPALVGSAHAAAGSTKTFAYTGGEQVYTVPDGVTVVRVAAIGAAGAAGATSTNGAGPGGVGGEVQADIPVSPGQLLFVEVGGTPDQPGPGGFNGGGDSMNGGGGGGGASDVRTCSRVGSNCSPGNDTLTSRLVVAGGGGGGGGPNAGPTHPGGSGGAAGAAGTWSTDPPYESNQGGPGNPGTASAGGDVAQENNVSAAGSPGVFGSGGAASTVSGQGGGGGGGGWFGGAAGGTSTDGIAGGGGGGGSSYAVPAARNVSIQLAAGATAPSIAITPLTATADPSARSIAFSSTRIGRTASPQGLTLTDNGQAPLYISGMALQGVDRGDFGILSSNCESPIPPGGSCRLMVGFSPRAKGTRAASLVISAEGLADQATPLTGKGIVVPRSSAGPPAGIQTCSGSGRARHCLIKVPSASLGLARGSHLRSFALRRGRTVIRGTASIHGTSVELHLDKRAPAGNDLLTIWTRHGKKQRLLRQLTIHLR